MAKTILKIFYIAVGLVLCVLFGVLNYNTGADEVYIEKINEAVKSDDMADLVSSFSSFSLPFDKNAYVTKDTNGKNKMCLYGSINRANVTYKADGVDKTYQEVEFVYYLFIKGLDFPAGNKLTTDGKTTNDSGIKFYNADGDSYVYYFIVSDTVNSSEYKSVISSPTEGLVNSKRDLVNQFTNTKFKFDFMLVTISETMVSYVKTKLNNKSITGYEVVDTNGNSVYGEKINVNIDFSQDYFNDMTQFRDSFRVYLNDEKKGTDEYNIACEYLDKCDKEKVHLTKANYVEGLARNEIYNAKLVWKSIGIGALFFLSFAIIYFLLFHFKLIKRIVFREKRVSNNRYVPNRTNGTYQAKATTNRRTDSTVIDAKVKEVKKEEPKPTIVEKPVETTEVVDAETAEEVKEEN